MARSSWVVNLYRIGTRTAGIFQGLDRLRGVDELIEPAVQVLAVFFFNSIYINKLPFH